MKSISVIYDCPIYEDLRKKYYSIHCCHSRDNILKENHFKVFCNPVNAVHSRRLCEYCYLYECFELRSRNIVQ